MVLNILYTLESLGKLCITNPRCQVHGTFDSSVRRLENIYADGAESGVRVILPQSDISCARDREGSFYVHKSDAKTTHAGFHFISL